MTLKASAGVASVIRCGKIVARRARELWRCRAGIAAVEFGMALPIFLMLVFGTIEFGRYLWSEHALSYAAEQATRYALANPGATTSQVKAYAEAQLMTIDKSDATVDVVQETIGGIAYLTVTVNYPFDAILPMLPLTSLAMTGVSRVPRDV